MKCQDLKTTCLTSVGMNCDKKMFKFLFMTHNNSYTVFDNSFIISAVRAQPDGDAGKRS